VVDVVQEKIKYIEKQVEVEKIVEVKRFVEIEREVEVERIVEREVEVDKIVEVVHEVPVEKVVEVEKLVGMREEEVEELKRSIQSEAEAQRQELLRLKEQTVAERAKQQTVLEAEEARMLDETAERERIRQQLEQYEAKIMHGGEHVRDRVKRREAELAQQQVALEQERAEEVALRQRLQAQEEEKLAQEEKYSSLQDEAQSKTRKLKQLWAKFRAAQSEIDDLQIEQQQEKQDLLHTVRELTRQVQLQNLVIESFVPPEEVAKLERRAVWDEDGSEQWRLLPLSEGRRTEEEVRPRSHPSLLRPTCVLSREMAADLTNNEPRFRSVNVLSFDLDMPERTTADYESAGVNPNVRAALTAALKDDEQLEVAAAENLPSMGIGGNGWTPGGDLGAPSAGLSNSMQAAKLQGRAGGGRDGARRTNATTKKPKKREDEDLDRLLGGGDAAPPPAAAEEEFPEARGLGGRRRKGSLR